MQRIFNLQYPRRVLTTTMTTTCENKKKREAHIWNGCNDSFSHSYFSCAMCVCYGSDGTLMVMVFVTLCCPSTAIKKKNKVAAREGEPRRNENKVPKDK